MKTSLVSRSQNMRRMQNARNPAAARDGFTLVEVLVVILIIGILMGLILAIGPAAIRLGKETAARGQMSNLKTAIESFKSTYGYYPPSNQGDSVEDWSKQLYSLLAGYRVPKLQENKLVFDTITPNDSTKKRRPFLTAETSVPLFKDAEGNESPEDDWMNRYYVDPWNNAFAYAYRKINADGILDRYTTWKNPTTYFLISAGDRFEEKDVQSDGFLPVQDYYWGDMQKNGLIPEDENYFYEAIEKGTTNRVTNLTSWKDR
jgi:prepilin-type N-terminal cleavage/methylation domain-containing protein